MNATVFIFMNVLLFVQSEVTTLPKITENGYWEEFLLKETTTFFEIRPHESNIFQFSIKLTENKTRLIEGENYVNLQDAKCLCMRISEKDIYIPSFARFEIPVDSLITRKRKLEAKSQVRVHWQEHPRCPQECTIEDEFSGEISEIKVFAMVSLSFNVLSVMLCVLFTVMMHLKFVTVGKRREKELHSETNEVHQSDCVLLRNNADQSNRVYINSIYDKTETRNERATCDEQEGIL